MKHFYYLFIFLFCSYNQIVANTTELNSSEIKIQENFSSQFSIQSNSPEDVIDFKNQSNATLENHFYTEVSNQEEEEHVKTVFFKRKVIGSGYFCSLFFSAKQFSFFHKTISKNYPTDSFLHFKAFDTLYVLFRVFRI
jgi:hypothetical protein